MALTYITQDRERKEKVRIRSRLWPICQSRHYLTPNTIEASASSEKKRKKNPISSSLSKISPSRCQKVWVNGLSSQPSPYGAIHKIRRRLTRGKIQRLVKICRRIGFKKCRHGEAGEEQVSKTRKKCRRLLGTVHCKSLYRAVKDTAAASDQKDDGWLLTIFASLY